jgi:ABC-2 type transport system ATP-binding protein
MFGLKHKRDHKISTLSGGERRRVSVLMALVGEPPIVFLDEPSSGIDPQNRRFMWEIIEGMRSESRAVILTTHHLEEAEALSEE